MGNSAVCCYALCRFAECCGAIKPTLQIQKNFLLSIKVGLLQKFGHKNKISG